MKLESIKIRDFRGIESLDLSFKDELDLIRDCIPIVGPNTSGKTTILDAIALSLMPMADVFQVREGLRWSPSALVRSGAARASVSSTVWFSDDEIEATKEVIARSGVKGHRRCHRRATLQSIGRTPILDHSNGGTIVGNQPTGWILSKGRQYLETYLHVPGLGPRLFQRLGGVFMFDQQRTGLSNLLSYQEQTPARSTPGSGAVRRGQRGRLDRSRRQPAIGAGRVYSHKGPSPDPDQPGDEGPGGPGSRGDGKRGLRPVKMALRARVPPSYDRRVVQYRAWSRIWNSGVTEGRYYYDGLSSGQQMILLMLLQFAHRRIHRSIVLIDELELHLHPLWQDRLYTALTRLGGRQPVLLHDPLDTPPRHDQGPVLPRDGRYLRATRLRLRRHAHGRVVAGVRGRAR